MNLTHNAVCPFVSCLQYAINLPLYNDSKRTTSGFCSQSQHVALAAILLPFPEGPPHQQRGASQSAAERKPEPQQKSPGWERGWRRRERQVLPPAAPSAHVPLLLWPPATVQRQAPPHGKIEQLLGSPSPSEAQPSFPSSSALLVAASPSSGPVPLALRQHDPSVPALWFRRPVQYFGWGQPRARAWVFCDATLLATPL